jgi:hypothetical protein
MAKPTKAKWSAWHDEINRYAKRETEGFTADRKALEQHIVKLREVARKDKAGWLDNTALTYLNQLQMKLDSIKSYVAGATP